jgi:hypothetical protein
MSDFSKEEIDAHNKFSPKAQIESQSQKVLEQLAAQITNHNEPTNQPTNN